MQLSMSTEEEENVMTRPNTPDMEIGGDRYMIVDGQDTVDDTWFVMPHV